MITETSTTALAELTEQLDRLRTELGAVQRELDASLQSWRSSLIAEKKDFQTLYQTKQDEAAASESAWQELRLQYEQKISALDQQFKTLLGQTEQNALRALNELDDSWQRDKLQWHQTLVDRVKELESREGQWQSEGERQEKFASDLQGEVEMFRALVTDRLAFLESEREQFLTERSLQQKTIETAEADREAAIETERATAAKERAELEAALKAADERTAISVAQAVEVAQQNAARELAASRASAQEALEASQIERDELLQRISTFERALLDAQAAETRAEEQARQEVREAWERDRAAWQASVDRLQRDWSTREAELQAEHQKKMSAFELVETQYISHQQMERQTWTGEKELLVKQARELEQKVARLEQADRAQLENLSTELERFKNQLHHEQEAWQQSLKEMQDDIAQRESAWFGEREHYERVIAKLEKDLAVVQGDIARQSTEPVAGAVAPDSLQFTVTTLEQQVSIINELMKHVAPAASNGTHAARLRRRTDLVEINDPTRVFR